MSNQYRCAKYNLKLDSRTQLDIIISAFLAKIEIGKISIKIKARSGGSQTDILIIIGHTRLVLSLARSRCKQILHQNNRV